MRRSGARAWTLCVLAAAVLAPSLFAQLYTGSVGGTVTDPSGAVVPNAKVTLTDIAKNQAQEQTTDANGNFVFRNVAPSTYSLRVETAGFTPYLRESFAVTVNQNVTIPVTLTVQAAGQTVEVVEGGAPLISTADASTGQTINRTFINDLPLIGRAVFDLARLAPGVSEPRGNGGWDTNFISQGSRNATADVLLDGVDITRLSPDGRSAFRREKIGYIFQSFRLMPALDAEENICLSLEIRRLDRRRERARAALATVGLAAKAHLRPSAMSHGEKQRVAVARAIAHDPPIVLADEPTASLDAANGAQVTKLLAELARDAGRIVAVVTHDPRVLPVAQRIIRLEDGRIVGDERCAT